MESPTPTYDADDSAAYCDDFTGEPAGSSAPAAAPAGSSAAAPPGTPPGPLPGTPQQQSGTPQGAPAAGFTPLPEAEAAQRRQREGGEEELPPWKRRAKRRGQGT